jgi:hypothetical protein
MSDTKLGQPLPRTFLTNLVRLANERKPDWSEIWSTQWGIIYAWSDGTKSEHLWDIEANRPDWTTWCIIRKEWENMIKQEAGQ